MSEQQETPEELYLASLTSHAGEQFPKVYDAPDELEFPPTSLKGQLGHALASAWSYGSLRPTYASHHESKWFIPLDELDRIIAEDSVKTEVESWDIFSDQDDIIRLVHDIIRVHSFYDKSGLNDSSEPSGQKRFTRQKLFAILILIGKPQIIIELVNAGIYDAHLPFRYTDGRMKIQRSTNKDLTTIYSFEKWNNRDFDLFQMYQWYMLAPRFNFRSKDVPIVHRYLLDKMTPLPFVNDEHRPSMYREDGAVRGVTNGVVRRVRIHPAHYRSLGNVSPYFAIKIFSECSHWSFKAELDAFERLLRAGNPHMTSLLATIEQGTRESFVFSSAKRSLPELWQFHHPDMGSRQPDVRWVRWMAKQFAGIASVLELLREPTKPLLEQPEVVDRSTTHELEQAAKEGIHRDLKPENILWFTSPEYDDNTETDGENQCPRGILKIAYFGQPDFYSQVKRKATSMSTSQAHHAPECGQGKDKSYADLWSFGCILLEFMVWYQYGFEEGIVRFANQRSGEESDSQYIEDKFFKREFPGRHTDTSQVSFKVKKTVNEEILRLRSASKRSNFTNDILNLIQDGLLQVNPHRRMECAKVNDTLKEICEKAGRDAGYCVGSVAGWLSIHDMNADLSVHDDESSLRSTALPSVFSSRTSTLSISEMSQESLHQNPQDATGVDGGAQVSKGQAPEPEDGGDIESILSDNISIRSKASSAIGRLESNAVHVLAEYFAGVEELTPLFQIAIDKMGKARFANNLRRMLKTFYLQLRYEASNERERMAVGVFRSRKIRARLADKMVQIIQRREENDNEDNFQFDAPLQESQVYRRALNEWLQRLPYPGEATPQHHNTPTLRGEGYRDDHGGYDSQHEDETRPLEDSDFQDDSDTESDHEEPEFPEIREIEIFLARGRAFRILRLELRILRLPGHLRELINTIPKASIKLSRENDTSILNRTKIFFEDYTGYQWDWSPLTSPLPDIRPGRMRVEWKVYTCDLQKEVTEETGNLLKEILPLLDDHPSDCYCCLSRPSSISLRFLISRGFRSFARRLGKFSGAFRRPTGGLWDSDPEPISSSDIWARRDSIDELIPSISAQTETEQQTPEPANSSPSNAQSYGTSTPSQATTKSLHVVFGVQGWYRSLELQGIPIPEPPCDSDFFKTLRTFHRAQRSTFLHWFSAFQFLNCRFVKFEKIFINGITSGSKDELPDDDGHSNIYIYNPRGPNVKPPVIDPNVLHFLLSECDEVCLWRFLNPWHRCIRLGEHLSYLSKIPKKTDGFSMLDETGEKIAFGIEAGYKVSLGRLAIYHLILILAPVGFWAWWMVKHPGDWQNATVPLLAATALIVVFWLLFDKRVRLVEVS